MAEKKYLLGDLVVVKEGDWKGAAGIVSWPITADEAGYVLVYSEERVAGLHVGLDQVEPANSTTKGFTQLCYLLNKLSSYLIEKAILMRNV